MVPSNNIINIRLINDRLFSRHRIIMEYLLLGVLAPMVLNLIHLGIGLFITKNQGNTYGVGFSAIGFVSKTAGMVFLTWLGVSYIELDFKIYVPLLTFDISILCSPEIKLNLFLITNFASKEYIEYSASFKLLLLINNNPTAGFG